MAVLSNIFSSLYSGKYRRDIDGLRAIAVTSVVICHAFPAKLPGGFIGVDIFFVISGYLISRILIDDLNTHSFSLLNFYDRRIRRIFPALIVVMAVTLATGWFLMFIPEFSLMGRHVAVSALFSENFLLWSESGYFDRSSDFKPLLHLWSLAIEEQFYIFWPMLMWLSRRGHVRFSIMFALLGIFSFATNLYDIGHDPAAAYYSPFGRFWELMIGAFLAYLEVDHPRILHRHGNLQSALGLGLITAALILVTPDRHFPGVWALLPTLGTFLMISAGPHRWINRHILGCTPFVWCGLISYPLYLWHWPILSYLHIVNGRPTHLSGVAAIVLAAVLATLTFFVIERPFRRRGDGPAKPVILAGAMAALLAVAVLVTIGRIPPRLTSTLAPARTEWSFLQSRSPHFDNSGLGIYTLHPERRRQILVIGDSHVAQYAERIDRAIAGAPDRPGAVLVLGAGCIPIPNTRTDEITRKGCWPQRDLAYRMAADPRFDTVVIGGAWARYFLSKNYYFDDHGERLDLKRGRGRSQAYSTLESELVGLRQSGKHVVFVLDNPQSAVNYTGRTVRLGRSGTRFAQNVMVKIDPAQVILRQDLLALGKRSGVKIIDPWQTLCTGDMCLSSDAQGMPLFIDSSHFNPDWAADHATFIDGILAP